MRKVYCYELRAELEVPESVNRVASLTPSVTAILIGLGLGDRIVGLSPWCRLLERFGIEVPRAPIVGSYDSIDLELLKRVEPDLVLLAGGYQSRIVESLREAGFSYFVTRLPRGLDILDLLVEIGYVVGRVDEAMELSRRCLEALYRAREMVRELSIEGLETLVVMRIGRDLVVPGLASHVTQTLGAIGLDPINKRVEASYVWGSRALEELPTLCREASVVLYQLTTPEPRIVEDEVSRICGSKPVAYLPTLSLSDYSHLYILRLRGLAKVIAEVATKRASLAVEASRLVALG